MSLQTKSFEFGSFCLEVNEKVLLRDGKPVPLTPKALQLLFVLVKNHGRIVEKSELMESVWAESFVEENNLTFTISLLRKSLNDDKQGSRYIETVPKRGYRFTADVKEIPQTNTFSPVDLNADREKYVADIAAPRSVKSFISLLVFGLLLVGAIAFSLWFVRDKGLAASSPVLNASFASEKLSTDGKVSNAVISPDGNKMVYTNGIGNVKESVWIRELQSGNNIEIIPPTENIYFGFAFSPDNAFIYFTRLPFSRRSQGIDAQIEIYRVSIFGGVPVKIIDGAQGWISISPDGKEISFVRCSNRDDEGCVLWIADAADGKNERKIASRQNPIRIGDHSFAPDGKSIAFVVGHSLNGANEIGIVSIDLESGAERELTKEKFFEIKKLEWLPDNSGLLFTASRISNKNYRIWQLSKATGEVLPITKDSESYLGLSLDKKADLIISTQYKWDYHLTLFQIDNPSASKKTLTDATTTAFAPNGKIIFSSLMSGNEEIWSVNADGTERRQLTNDPADDLAAIVSPDGNSIYFASNRTGAIQVWRMNTDGTNQTPITSREGGFPLAVSPDGEWIYYKHGLKRTLWRVSAGDNKIEQQILDQESEYFAVSPDCTQVALPENQEGNRSIKIISLIKNGQTLQTFRAPEKSMFVQHINWMPDRKSLFYISVDSETEIRNLWRQSTDEKIPEKIANIGDERVLNLALAPDGKSFAVVEGRWLYDAVLMKGLK